MRGSLLIALVAAVACGKPGEGATTTAATTATATATATATTTATTTTTTTATTTTTTTATATPAPDTVIAQHILVAYKTAKRAPRGVTRSKTEAVTRAQEALAKIRGGTSFEDAVKAYSDDTGSAERLGSVGKFHRQDMDPAFSAAAFALPVGGVSGVVESPFGFHIIKRTQ